MEREGNEPVVPSLHIVADEAVYDSARSGWSLRDGYLRLFAGRDVERTFAFEELRPTTFTETPEQLLAQPKEPEEMTYG
ncbi:MAG: hypothetical protein GWN06_04440, partial [Gemmatimonadetes bacterium]|nr:hypothetical protein [Gemmatimonadota bacterium]